MTHSNPSPGGSAEQWHVSALEHLAKNRIEDAVRCLRRALELDPDAAEAWNGLGVILEALGNRRDAVHCYRRALRARPGMEEPLRNLLALAAQAALSAGIPAPARNRAALAVAR